MNVGVRWVVAPDRELIPNTLLYGERVHAAVRAVAEYIAQKIQGEARQNAPWTDRTGNARSGLFSVVEAASRDLVHIYLSHGHTVYYGIFLELSRGGRYKIIMPTIEANEPVVTQMLREIFS